MTVSETFAVYRNRFLKIKISFFLKLILIFKNQFQKTSGFTKSLVSKNYDGEPSSSSKDDDDSRDEL